MGELMANMLGAAFPPTGGTANFVVALPRTAASWTGKSKDRTQRPAPLTSSWSRDSNAGLPYAHIKRRQGRFAA